MNACWGWLFSFCTHPQANYLCCEFLSKTANQLLLFIFFSLIWSVWRKVLWIEMICNLGTARRIWGSNSDTRRGNVRSRWHNTSTFKKVCIALCEPHRHLHFELVWAVLILKIHPFQQTFFHFAVNVQRIVDEREREMEIEKEVGWGERGNEWGKKEGEERTEREEKERKENCFISTAEPN